MFLNVPLSQEGKEIKYGRMVIYVNNPDRITVGALYGFNSTLNTDVLISADGAITNNPGEHFVRVPVGIYTSMSVDNSSINFSYAFNQQEVTETRNGDVTIYILKY